MTSPIVSVVMSVFNGQRYVADAVESMLSQAFQDFEFIVVDDGSTDKTSEILAEYAKLDSRVRIISQRNTGRAEALNNGIGVATGRYIARMDADDISIEDRLESQVGFMNAHPEVGVLGGAYEQIDSMGRILNTIGAPLEDAAIKIELLRGNPMCHPAIMMRKEAVLAAGGYRKQLLDADDYDLWLRMAEFTCLANLETVILRYRVHAEQVSIRSMRRQILCFLAAGAAATRRRRGERDPLVGVGDITVQFLNGLGIPEVDIQERIRHECEHRMELLIEADPDALVRFVEREEWDSALRSVLAANLVRVARIQCKRHRFGRAARAGMKALFVGPLESSRILTTALTRRLGALSA